MRAKLVLDDCRKALALAEEARTEQEFRVYWVALLALLRAVGHVLVKVDAETSPALRTAVDARWERWKRKPNEHRVFWDFIEASRNSVLKTYEMGVPPGNVEVILGGAGGAQSVTLDENIFKPLLDGPFAGEDGRDVARRAIAWWERELSAIANETWGA